MCKHREGWGVWDLQNKREVFTLPKKISSHLRDEIIFTPTLNSEYKSFVFSWASRHSFFLLSLRLPLKWVLDYEYVCQLVFYLLCLAHHFLEPGTTAKYGILMWKVVHWGNWLSRQKTRLSDSLVSWVRLGQLQSQPIICFKCVFNNCVHASVDLRIRLLIMYSDVRNW